MNVHSANSSVPPDDLQHDIRQICHDLSNPLGILRMAVFFLQTARGSDEKRAEYYAMMNASLDKIDTHLKRLRDIAASGQPPGEEETHRT
jgi:signal transduction histidine kinase